MTPFGMRQISSTTGREREIQRTSHQRKENRINTAPAALAVTSEMVVVTPEAVVGSAVRWRSKSPHTGVWVDYDDAVSAGLEEKFQKGRQQVSFQMYGMKFGVDFTPGAMKQFRPDALPGQGTVRVVERVDMTQHQTEATSQIPVDRGRVGSSASGTASCPPAGYSRAPGREKVEARILEEAPAAVQKPSESAQTGAADSITYEKGELVEYFSATHDTWIPAIVVDVDAAGQVEVDVKPTFWIPKAQQTAKLRLRDGVAAAAMLLRSMRLRDAAGTPKMLAAAGDAAADDAAVGTPPTSPGFGDGPSAAIASSFSPFFGTLPSLREQSYEPSPRSVIVIGPGGGTSMNRPAYRGLEADGWDLTYALAPNYDRNPAVPTDSGFLYPPGWESGEPDLTFAGGKNLATLADDIVIPMIEKLIAVGKGPAAIICGSRGGQVCLPRLWAIGWRGPTLCINGGCVSRTIIPGAPSRLILITGGQDMFETRDPLVTASLLRKADSSQPVLLYHDPKDAHMPASFGDVVGPLLEIVVNEERFQASVKAATDGPCTLPQPKAHRYGVSLKVL